VVQNDQGALKELFSEDNDTFLLDDRLLIWGTQAMWQEAKEMGTAQSKHAFFMEQLNLAIGTDTGSITVGGPGVGLGRRDPYYPLYRSTVQ
jgi:hypothetical protein